MPSFYNGAIEIAYLDHGNGNPIILVHGFASNKIVNWVYPAWVYELKKNGRRVIELHNRGHGESSKLYEIEDYHIDAMANHIDAMANNDRALFVSAEADLTALHFLQTYRTDTQPENS